MGGEKAILRATRLSGWVRYIVCVELAPNPMTLNPILNLHLVVVRHWWKINLGLLQVRTFYGRILVKLKLGRGKPSAVTDNNAQTWRPVSRYRLSQKVDDFLGSKRIGTMRDGLVMHHEMTGNVNHVENAHTKYRLRINENSPRKEDAADTIPVSNLETRIRVVSIAIKRLFWCHVR